MNRLCFSFAATAAGTVFDLDAVSWGGRQPVLTITASAVDSSGKTLPAQKLLLDTGSSTLAFCDETLVNSLQDSDLGFYSCNLYGSPGSLEGYWGPFFDAPLSMTSASGDQIKIPKSHFSVMKNEFMMPCLSTTTIGGVNGIFGVAFKQLDQATSQKPSGWSSESAGSCPSPTTDYVEPLMQYLNDEGGVKQMGIYWSGQVGDGQGALYLDGDATANEHHDAQKASAIGKAHLGEFGWMDIGVDSLEFDGQSFSDVVCNPQQGAPCIMDTGTPILILPTNVVQAMNSAQQGTLKVKLTAKNPSDAPVTLDFDVRTLLENGWVEPGNEFILGLPLWAFYYTALDISDNSVLFTPQTPAFVAV